MNKVEMLHPSNDFSIVAEEAGKALEYGIIIGCDSDGEMVPFSGGLKNGKMIDAEDVLMLIEEFKFLLMAGGFSDD